MKKILMFLLLSIFLQAIYYFLILRNHNFTGLKAYNWISIVSVFFFLGYYIHKSFFILRFDKTRNAQNLIVSFMIVIAMFSFIFFITFFGNMLTAVYGVVVHQIDGYHLLRLYSNPQFGDFIEYHFIRLQFSLIILNIFMNLILQRDRFKVRRFIKYYKLLTIIIILGTLGILVMNFGFFYYYNFLIISTLFFWLAIPVLYNVSSQFHHYYGVMIGWLITVIMFWFMIDEFFSKYRMVVGYVFEG